MCETYFRLPSPAGTTYRDGSTFRHATTGGEPHAVGTTVLRHHESGLLLKCGCDHGPHHACCDTLIPVVGMEQPALAVWRAPARKAADH
jgi:hypothetical protein